MKHLSLLFILPLCLSVAWAEKSNDLPTINPVAQTLVDEATTFVDTYLDEVTGFERDTYLQKLEDLAKDVDPEASLKNFDPASYMKNVNDKVEDMLDQFKNFEKVGDNREEYLKQVGTFLSEVMKDIESGMITDLTTDDYIADLDRLNDSFVTKLEYLNAPEQDKNAYYGFNPEEYMDRATGQTRRAVSVEFQWAGIGDHWLNVGVMNITSIINAFQSRFAHDSVAQADFGYLKSMWPKGSEVYGMNAAYDDSVYDDAGDPNIWRNKQAGNYQTSYVVDEYGAPTDPKGYEDQLDSKGNTTNLTVNTMTANNRSWGYRYNNGTNVTISVTTNGRTYNLQESIYTSPLVLDLDNDGAIEASGGYWLPHTYRDGKLAEFDMDGDGFVDLCEWVGPNDGILLVYNGGDVDANNFFGWAGGFAHGFEKLSLLDGNADGQIAAEELATLSVWRDANGNARVDEGEIASVASMGITSISIRHDSDLVSSYIQNGETRRIVDWHPCVFSVRRTR